MNKVFSYLDKLGIDYEIVNHRPVFTAEQLPELENKNIVDIKNLFLTNKNHNKFYLFSMPVSRKVMLKEIQNKLSLQRLKFASENELESMLKVKPGSVSIFNLINDIDNKVELYLDKQLFCNKLLDFHPNINNITILVNETGIKKYLENIGNKFQMFDI